MQGKNLNLVCSPNPRLDVVCLFLHWSIHLFAATPRSVLGLGQESGWGLLLAVLWKLGRTYLLHALCSGPLNYLPIPYGLFQPGEEKKLMKKESH